MDKGWGKRTVLPGPKSSKTEVFGSFLLSLLWILFQAACLFPLRLFGLAVQELVEASYWEWLVPAVWWVELSLFPLMGRATFSGMFWSVCELSMTLGRFSADGFRLCSCLASCLVAASSTIACRYLSRAKPWCSYGDLQVTSHWLIFLGAGNSLAVQSWLLLPSLTLTSG